MTINIEFEDHAISNEELALCVAFIRTQKGWTQEVLAELADTSLRTIQRVEKGQPSSTDTRRSIAGAFEFEDIDIFNKPISMPNFEKLRHEYEKIEKETIEKPLEKIDSGKRLRELIELGCAFGFNQLVDLTNEAEEIFAELHDYIMDYECVSDEYTNTQKLEVHHYFDEKINDLKKIGFSLGAITQGLLCAVNGSKEKVPLESIYLIIANSRDFPEKVRISKKVRMS